MKCWLIIHTSLEGMQNELQSRGKPDGPKDHLSLVYCGRQESSCWQEKVVYLPFCYVYLFVICFRLLSRIPWIYCASFIMLLCPVTYKEIPSKYLMPWFDLSMWLWNNSKYHLGKRERSIYYWALDRSMNFKDLNMNKKGLRE